MTSRPDFVSMSYEPRPKFNFQGRIEEHKAEGAGDVVRVRSTDPSSRSWGTKHRLLTEKGLGFESAPLTPQELFKFIRPILERAVRLSDKSKDGDRGILRLRPGDRMQKLGFDTIDQALPKPFEHAPTISLRSESKDDSDFQERLEEARRSVVRTLEAVIDTIAPGLIIEGRHSTDSKPPPHVISTESPGENYAFYGERTESGTEMLKGLTEPPLRDCNLLPLLRALMDGLPKVVDPVILDALFRQCEGSKGITVALDSRVRIDEGRVWRTAAGPEIDFALLEQRSQREPQPKHAMVLGWDFSKQGNPSLRSLPCLYKRLDDVLPVLLPWSMQGAKAQGIFLVPEVSQSGEFYVSVMRNQGAARQLWGRNQDTKTDLEKVIFSPLEQVPRELCYQLIVFEDRAAPARSRAA